MAQKKVIAVVGSTGAQGGGLVRAILADREGEFAARALTRKPQSEAARSLADRGAEVVPADLDQPETLTRAFDGAYGAYCVTNFWEYFSPERELAQAQAMARAARDAGLRHVIWSTLEDTRQWVPLSDPRMPTLMGKYKVPHFDAKGEANHFFSDLGLPVTFLLTSFYWENFIRAGMGPRADSAGVLTLSLPMGDQKLPGIAVEDIGRCAYGIFKRGQSLVGKTVGIAGEHLTGVEMAAAFARAFARPVRYHPISPEEYRSLGFPGAQDLGNMFQFMRDFSEVFCKPRDPSIARSLNPSLQSFDSWLVENKDRIPIG